MSIADHQVTPTPGPDATAGPVKASDPRPFRPNATTGSTDLPGGPVALFAFTCAERSTSL